MSPKRIIVNGIEKEWEYDDSIDADGGYKLYWDQAKAEFILGDFRKLIEFLIENSGRKSMIEKLQMQNDITYLGKVIRVNSDTVEVEISADIPSASPIINGKVYKLGQIGTFVKIIAGNISSFGLVESVSNTPTNNNDVTIVSNVGSQIFISTFNWRKGWKSKI